MMRTALLTLIAFSVAGCSHSSVWAPRVAGRIVDKETRQPIAGAPVFANYRILDGIGFEGGGASCCVELNWTKTDADGRFEFPAHRMHPKRSFLDSIPSYPALYWLHPSYGRDALEYWPFFEEAERYRDLNWENLELEMSRNEQFIRAVNEGKDFGYICDSHVKCWVACEAWFGGEAECLKRSGGRRFGQ